MFKNKCPCHLREILAFQTETLTDTQRNMIGERNKETYNSAPRGQKLLNLHTVVSGNRLLCVRVSTSFL